MSTLVVGVACEDNGHFFAVSKLVDAALISRHTWLDGIIEDCRRWHGLADDRRWYKYDKDDACDLRPIVLDGRTIAPSGHIAGVPLKPEAGMWRRTLLLFCHCEPRPDVVVLARDLDGYPRRREGMEQAALNLRWPFKIAIATAQPEVEAWVVSGFVPKDAAERERLRELREQLSFDPTAQSERLTSHPNDAGTDAKRVLSRLCGDDVERQGQCLDDRALLLRRGAGNGLSAFLAEIDQQIVPALSQPQ
jgi:hypothetical protein